MRAAGFWRRAAAWSLDALPVAALTLALCTDALRAAAGFATTAWNTLAEGIAAHMASAVMAAASTSGPPGLAWPTTLAHDILRDRALLASADALQSALLTLATLPLAAFVLLFMAWCVGFERSTLRATPGKRALGLRVMADGGGVAGTGTLLLRFLAGTLSWLSLNIGHAMAGVPPRYAALHDRISRTQVLLDAMAPARMPGWAVVWLAALAAASLVACAWLAAMLAAGLQAALDRALWG